MKTTGEAVICHPGYQAVAKRMRVTRYLLIVLLIIGIILSYFLFRQDFSLEKIRFFLRNLELTPSSETGLGDLVYYNGRRDGAVAFVEGALVNVAGENVAVTDHASATLYAGYHGYRAPALLTAGSYFLLYDRAGNGFSLYDPFSKRESGEAGGTILQAALAANGSYAVAYGSYEDYDSIVTVYDAEGKLLNRLSKYKYVTGLALDEAGDYLLTGSIFIAENGRLSSEIQLLELGRKEAALTLTCPSALYRVCFFEDGHFAALFEDGVRFYQETGELAFVPWDKAPRLVTIGDDGILLLTDEADSRKGNLLWLDSEGNTLLTLPLEERILSCALSRDGAALLFEDGVFLLDKRGGLSRLPLSGDDVYAVVSYDGVFYAVSSQAIRRLDPLLAEEEAVPS